MAIEKAKELVKLIGENEELMAAFKADPRAALEAGDYGCTFEELKEAIVMSRKLDEKELDSITGGGNPIYGSSGVGNCKGTTYKEECAATVEVGSWCGTNDWCNTWEVIY